MCIVFFFSLNSRLGRVVGCFAWAGHGNRGRWMYTIVYSTGVWLPFHVLILILKSFQLSLRKIDLSDLN